MMRAFVWIIILLFIQSWALSCGGNGNTADEVNYELGMSGTVEDTESEVTTEPGYTVDLEILKSAVESEPDSPDARFVYMAGLVSAEDYMEALEQCRILDDIDNENIFKSATYLNFGTIVLDHISVDDPARDDLINEAIEYLWVGLGLEPESISSHRVLGLLSLESGDNDKALHHLAIALSATEIGYKPRMQMAEIYITREDHSKAREHLEIALELAEESDDSEAVNRINTMLASL